MISQTYDWVLLFLVCGWELGDDLALEEVVFVHPLIVSFISALLEPNIQRAEIPRLLLLQT